MADAIECPKCGKKAVVWYAPHADELCPSDTIYRCMCEWKGTKTGAGDLLDFKKRWEEANK